MRDMRKKAGNRLKLRSTERQLQRNDQHAEKQQQQQQQAAVEHGDGHEASDEANMQNTSGSLAVAGGGRRCLDPHRLGLPRLECCIARRCEEIVAEPVQVHPNSRIRGI